MDPATLLMVFAPMLTDVVKRIVGKFTGGAQPQTVDEQVKLNDSDTQKLQALSSLDKADGASLWVVNLRASIRPIIAIIVTVTWAIVVVGDIAVDDSVYRLVVDAAASVWFYLFGERMYMGLDGRKR